MPPLQLGTKCQILGNKALARAGPNDLLFLEAPWILPRRGIAASILSNIDQMYQRMDEIFGRLKIVMDENE